eukprot:CAMPEP_0178675212 /NCGR_PEP_ID=MMETSP0698-20121128/35270_1 /TAXON_ID=265572 /ORGANISM="Extubocellulus spinifer, Strain CCMP396" /LENGTH=178 /DNA_ID=CAMNT_0020319385 /DNA_START=55 /DNA_END=588 /DNA_ORIENTATION=-
MTSDVRQRKNAAGGGADAAAGPDSSSPAFTKRAEEEKRRRELDAATEEAMKTSRPSFIGRFILCIGLPTLVGFCGMLISYLSKVAEGKADAQLIDFDRDFVFPFILMLVVVLVVGFQTKNFTRSEPKPFIAWPKVKRKRKVVRRRVVVDDDGNAVEDSVAELNDTGAGKQRRGRLRDW